MAMASRGSLAVVDCPASGDGAASANERNHYSNIRLAGNDGLGGNYLAGDLTMLPTLDNSVLIAVDVQIGFVTPESAHVVPIIADLVSRWQRAGGATVFTQFVNSIESPYVRLIGWEQMMPGTPEVEFAPEIRQFLGSATIVTPKGTYSSLTTPVMEFIHRTGRNNVWISGLDTESCVLATAVAAFDADLNPWVITDACASHAGQSVHQAGLLVAGRNLGQGHLVTTAAIPTEVLTWA